MSDAFATINAVVNIEKKGETTVVYTAMIENFSESGISRDISFERTYGGAYLPNKTFGTDMTFSFNFITTDDSFLKLIDNTTSKKLETLEVWNLYKISLKFDDTTNAFAKIYYNCYVNELTYSQTDDIITGKISFKLSPNNHVGYSNYYEIADTISNVNTYITNNDSNLGYD